MKIEKTEKEIIVTVFEDTDINKNGQLIVPEGVTKIKVPSRQFTSEVEELRLPTTLKNIVGSINMPNLKKLFMPYLQKGETHGHMFERCYKLGYVEIGAGFIDKWTFYHCPVTKLKIVGDVTIYSDCAFAGQPSQVNSIEIADCCKSANINLLAVPYINEIKFPTKFNPNLNIFFALEDNNRRDCKFVVNKLTKENLVSLLAYCPEAYLCIDKEKCDAKFRERAKDMIVYGMTNRAMARGYKTTEDTQEDIAILYNIKAKMKQEELTEKSFNATFKNAIDDFRKD